MNRADGPGSRPAVVRLRQRRPDPNNLMGVFTFAAIVWVFAGFGIFWLRTGSGRIGDGGTYTLAGEVVWIGPLVAWAIAYRLGPHGPLRRLWEEPVRLLVDGRGVTWMVAHDESGFGSWDDIGGVSSGMDWRGPWRSIRRSDGAELITVRGPLVDETTTRPVALPMILVGLRPDVFEALDVRHPERACVRRGTG
jgi:hypothetical protein